MVTLLRRYSTRTLAVIVGIADEHTQSLPIKFRITVAATGEAEKAPTLTYRNNGQQSTTTSAASDASTTNNADSGNDAGGIKPTATMLALGGGAVGLVALILVGVLLITRKRR